MSEIICIGLCGAVKKTDNDKAKGQRNMEGIAPRALFQLIKIKSQQFF